MTYLSRAVFEFRVDWSSQPSARWEYDLREAQIGHGAPVYAPLQAQVMAGWSLEVVLETDGAIAAYDAFTEALTGRLRGFWLPTPLVEAEIEEYVSETEFRIRDQNLRDVWADGTPLHLYFRSEDGVLTAAAKVTAVVQDGAWERVTVDTEVGVDQGWEVKRLVYVRLAGEEEEGEFEAEGWQVRRVRVEELTEEYLEAELGQKPIWLYHLWSGSEHWRYTSWQESVTSGGQTWETKPITHGGLRVSTKGEREDTSIKTFWQDGNPLTKFVPFDLLEPLWIEIIETSLADLEATTVRFTGTVQEPSIDGSQISAGCANWLDVLGRQFPRMIIGPRCNNFLFDSGCKLSKLTFETPATILWHRGIEVRVEGAALAGIEANYFAYGWLETFGGERRAILGSTADNGAYILLTLNMPLRRAAVDDPVNLYPGCDGVVNTCRDKFDNLVNFGGHPYIVKNLSVRAMEAETAHGNKK